jgi:ribosomal protein S18 acetylase RimI-like enzyme
MLVRHRAEMFASMGMPRDRTFEAMVEKCGPWFRERLAGGTYLGFLIETAGDDSSVVAGGGLLLLDWPPTYSDPHTTRGYILNVYVEPEHRGRGLARYVTEACLEACRSRAIRVVTLHSADAARRIYENLGFVPTNEMRLKL